MTNPSRKSGPSPTEELRQAARTLGFDLVAVVPAAAPPTLAALDHWLARGLAGDMTFFKRRRAAYNHPDSVLAGARTIVMLAVDYGRGLPDAGAGGTPPAPNGSGIVARFAHGDDYHAWIRTRLRQLERVHADLFPSERARGVVDTAPLLERAFAEMAGLGFIGRNAVLINPRLGSWIFLAALVSTAALDVDPPATRAASDPCGNCRACLAACPTGAILAPRVIDASRCVSYLTIELRGPVPRALREAIGDRVFGCDTCQAVCPWNHAAHAQDSFGNACPARAEDERDAGSRAAFRPREGINPLPLAALFDLDDAAFRGRFKGTSLLRGGRTGLLRNAAIVLGNQRAAAATPLLVKALYDGDPVVRGAAAWALGRLVSTEARNALDDRFEVESDATVREEIVAARSSMRTAS